MQVSLPWAPGVYQHVTPCGGLPRPSPGDLPDPGIESLSLPSPALAGGFFTTSATWEAPGLRQTPRKTGNFCKEESVLPSWKQEGPGFLDHRSPSFISTAITCRMALIRSWKRIPVRLGRGHGKGLRHGVLHFSFRVGQARPPSWGLSLPTNEMMIRTLAYLSFHNCPVRNKRPEVEKPI